MSLRRFREVDKHNDGVLEIWRRMDRKVVEMIERGEMG